MRFYVRTTRNTGLSVTPRWSSREALWLLTAAVLVVILAVTYWYAIGPVLLLLLIGAWMYRRRR